MRKLSRREITEGLESVPIEAVLLGVNNPAGIRLTAKQKRFAEEIAKGETKAEAYRRAYKHTGKPKTASNEGQKLMKSPAVSAHVEAFKLALERQKYTTPAALRALVIDKLTEKVLDPEIPPAQQLKALHLLGQVTEVAAFTERRETVRITASADLRSQLLESIRKAIKADAIDVETVKGDELLAELTAARAAGPGVDESTAGGPHPDATPPDALGVTHQTSHSNPHIQSSPNDEAHLPDVSDAVIVESNSEDESGKSSHSNSVTVSCMSIGGVGCENRDG